MRKNSALLCCLLLAGSALISGVPKKGTSVKKKAPVYDTLPAFYSVTPAAYNDDLSNTDAMDAMNPDMGLIRVKVPAETIDEAWSYYIKKLPDHATKIQLSVVATTDFDRVSPADLHALAETVQSLGSHPRAIVLRAATPEGLSNLASRIHFLGDREAGRQSLVIQQVYLVLALQNARFQGTDAYLDIRATPLPTGLRGLHPRDHRDSSDLMEYTAKWAAGRDAGPMVKP